jgi:phosphatidylserine/phosphatidylglycerophosphate/cardiolipin synthase-like enzyme
MPKSIVLALMPILLITGCSAINLHIEQPNQVAGETNKDPETLFCPRQDCKQELLNRIKNSTTIKCALFNINDRELLDKLRSKNAQVFIEEEYESEIQNKGISYRHNTKKSLMHNKFCIFDNDTVWTGSLNPTEQGIARSNNNVVILHSRFLKENYEAEFIELWEGQSSSRARHPQVILNGMLIENYFCPEDCDFALNRILSLINEAKHSINFMTFSFTDDSIGGALIEKHKSGLEIKGLFEKSQNSRYSEYPKLKKAGIDARLDSPDYTMHNKVFIIDNTTVITGSWNPTKSGTEKNDENIVIIHNKEIAGRYNQELERLWKTSEPEKGWKTIKPENAS